MEIKTAIRELSLGSAGVIVGYDRAYGGYIGKLCAKGLIPGKTFVVLEATLLGSYVSIMLPEKIVHLSKPEANALCIEAFTKDEDSY